MNKDINNLAMGAVLTATTLTGNAQVEVPANDDILPEPTRTEPLRLIEPELPIESVDRTPVVFENEDLHLKLSGTLFTPRKDGPAQGKAPANGRENSKLKAVIVAGPMHSTKELPQSNYAIMLANDGYATLVYDNSYIGSSEGHPRGLEDPDVKASDLKSAVSYLQTLDFIDKDHITAIGICGSGSYIPYGAKDDPRVKAVVSIVPFTIMDRIIQTPDSELLKDKEVYEKTGVAKRVNLTAGSPGEAYYLNAQRGATPNYVNAVSWSALSWKKFHPTQWINELKQPYLVIVGENAFSKNGGLLMYNNSTSEHKELHITKEATHFEMYDGEKYVKENISVIENFLKKYL